MKAILMAAGVGSRISTTVQKPKSTLRIKDTTLIGHTVDLLYRNNIDVAVVVGYQKEMLYEAVKDFPATFFYNPFYRVTNSMASLWFAQSFISPGEDLILANADVFWEQEVLHSLLEDKHNIVMLGDRTRTNEGDYFFKLVDGQVSKYGKDLQLYERSCEYVGIAKLDQSFVTSFQSLLNKSIDDGIYNMWWENVLYENSIENPIFVKDVDGKFWAEVDYIEDYQRVLNYLRSK